MISFPYDNESEEVQDRAIDSEIFANYLHKLNGYKSGIFLPLGTKAEVRSSSGMSVDVLPCDGAIKGIMFEEKETRNLLVQASESLDRYDLVVIRLDKLERNIDLYVRKGTASQSPVAPNVVRSGDIWEIAVAEIFIARNTTEISQSRISSLRLNGSYCELLPTINTADTTGIYNQFEAALNEYMQVVASALSETTAYKVGVQTYVHNYNTSTKVHNFIGSGENGKALITAGFTKGDTFAVNGVAVDAYTGRYSTAELLNGRYMTFVFDGTTINFESNITPLTQKVLWANASVTSSFAAQTIALDLSEYTHLIIEFRGSTSFSTISTVLIRRGSNSIEFSSDKNGYRSVTFSATGVVFSAANVFPVYGDTQIAVNNNYGIPAVIYGVKGVQ